MSGVVIGVGAAVGAVVGGGSSIYGISKQNRNAIKAFKTQMKYLQMNYNYNQAAMDRQEKSMYDSAMVELFGMSMNAYQNNAQIEAAIAETGLEGRSQGKVIQTIHGQTARQETAVKEAYKQEVWDLRGRKEALYISTKSEVEQAKSNLNNNLSYGSKAFQQVLGGAVQGAAIGAVTAGVASAASSALTATTATTAPTIGGMEVGVSTLGETTGAVNMSTLGVPATGATVANTGGASFMATSAIPNASIATVSTGSSVGASFMGSFNTALSQQKPWMDFYSTIGMLGGAFTQNSRRGGYYY